jgi:hypothetical protein
MVHAGNHPHSDVAVAGRFGIGIEPFFQGNLNARESQLAAAKDFDTLLPSLLAGCSRLARLGTTEHTSQHQELREVAGHTAGPRIVKSKYSKSYRVIWVEGSLRLTPEPRSSLLRFANIIKSAGNWAQSWNMLS